METRTLKEVEEVLECIRDGSGKVVTRIMLDNMVKKLPEGGIDVSLLQQAVQLINGVVDTEVRETPIFSLMNCIKANAFRFQ